MRQHLLEQYISLSMGQASQIQPKLQSYGLVMTPSLERELDKGNVGNERRESFNSLKGCWQDPPLSLKCRYGLLKNVRLLLIRATIESYLAIYYDDSDRQT